MVHQKNSVCCWNSTKCQMIGLSLVVCSMTLARRLTHDHQSWSLNVEPGDRCVLPSGVENEQCLRRLISRAHWDILVRYHGQLWRPVDRACTRLAQAGAANEVYRAADQVRVSADQNGRQVTLLHSSPAGADSEHAVNCQPADCYSSQSCWWRSCWPPSLLCRMTAVSVSSSSASAGKSSCSLRCWCAAQRRG